MMSIDVPSPLLSVQGQIVVLKGKHTAIHMANAALLPAALERVFQSEATT